MNTRARLIVLLLALLLVGCGDALPERPCAEWKNIDVITYPNMGLLALGPAYTALALMPVTVTTQTCVRYKS